MPTEKQILTFAVDDKLLQRIKDFRFDNRIETKSEALRILMEEGLKKYEGKKKKEPGQEKEAEQKKIAQHEQFDFSANESKQSKDNLDE